MGGLLLLSELPRRSREIPLALLAKAAGRLGLGPCLSPPSEPMDDMRFAFDAVVPVRTLALRALSFMAECRAVRSLRALMVLVSESEGDPPRPLSGLFSSLIVGNRPIRGMAKPEGDGEKLPVLLTSNDRNGGVRCTSGELLAKFRLSNRARGEPSAGREGLAPFERNPAWNLLGLAPPFRLVASGTSRLGLDSS